MRSVMFKPLIVLACATTSALAACAGAAGVARALSPPTSAPVPARVAKAADGHYWAHAVIDGRALDLLVDTGAGPVALTAADARTLGLDPSRLVYDRPVATAAGRTQAAAVTLHSVAVGSAEVRDVRALVVRRGLERSLLGMSYLGRLKSFGADADGLALAP